MTLLAQPDSASRKALVIGNEHYPFLSAIPAALRGARKVAEALQRVGFQVTEAYDLPLADLGNVIDNQFLRDLKPGDVCVVYYSGYGLQHEETNYFVPVDFNPQSQREVYAVAYAIDRLQSFLTRHRPALKILLIEASWDNTKLSQWADKIGLASPEGSQADTVWVFDTAPNTTITETDGGLGWFTAAFLHALPKPGLTVSDIIQAVQNEVSAASQARQQPYPVGASNFHFIPPKTKAGYIGVNGRDKLQYAWIPSGSFEMGCVGPIDRNCAKDEFPRHPVTIKPGFWITNTEVTVSAYDGFRKHSALTKPQKRTKTNQKGKYTEHPVTEKTWQDAVDYCRWAGGRLPTEAEWEYAARAGKDGTVYPWGNEFDPKLCNSIKSDKFRGGFPETTPVRQFDLPNDWGLLGIIGNVREWVWDVYDLDAYHASSTDPRTTTGQGKDRVVRGGSFGDGEKQLRLSARYHLDPSKFDNQTGFRCVVPELPQ
jgi:formylglycine-generating enzyme required for sulfatase activity